MHRKFLTALFICFAPAVYAKEISPAKIVKFDKYATETFRSWNIPGLAIAIVQDKQLVYLKTFGEKEIASGKKIDKDTVFRLCSLSKGMTSELVGILVEQKKLKWNSKIAAILDDFKLKSPAASRNLTLEHILSHTSGFSSYTLSSIIEKKYDRALLAKKLSTQDTLCRLGKCYAYQNYVFSLAGDVIEKVTGEKFSSEIDAKIFSPLGMKNTSSGKEGFINSKNRALPHHYENSTYQVSLKDEISTYYEVSEAGGANSSISDMVIWLKAQFGNYPQVISKENLAKVQTIYVDIPRDSITKSNSWILNRVSSAHYGLGWRILNYDSHKLVFHPGLLNGFTNVIGFLPEEKVGIVILSNSNTPIPNLLMARFLDLYLDLPLIDYSQKEIETYPKW